MYYPSLTEVKNMGHLGNLVPIYREINADLETPVSAYLKVARPPYSFLLESVEGGEHLARYSFIGTEPDHLIETGPGRKDGEVDPLGILEDILSNYKVVKSGYLPRFMGGAVGYLSYEVVRYFEDIPHQNSDVLD
ncbi:MAG: anthranilate synthase component I, partial [Dehalococcoidia bacterium]